MATLPSVTTPTGRKIRLLIADDHKIFRQSLRVVLQKEGFDIIGEASDGPEAVELTRSLKPDITILDLGMPTLGGIDAARKIHESAPRTHTILLTMHEDERYAVEALRAGMHGYVLKSQATSELVATIKEVAQGAIRLSRAISPAAISAFANGISTTPDQLTHRERQVLHLIADGKTTRQIAERLGLAAKTIESHRNRIMHKLNVHRTADLIRYAVRHHLIRP